MKHVFAKSWILGVAILSLFSTGARAADDAHLVRELNKSILVLNHDVYVYNWFNAKGRDKIWTTALSATDPAGYDHLRSMGMTFWQSLCSNVPSQDPSDCTDQDVNTMPGRYGAFGAGLYTAVDPKVTSGYGGGSGWVLMEVHLPKGFRMLSFVNRNSLAKLSKEAADEFRATDCPDQWAPDIAQLLTYLINAHAWNTGKTLPPVSGNPSSSQVSQKCILSVRHLLKDRLRLEAFNYNFGSTALSNCSPPTQVGAVYPARQGAFVITDVSRLSAADVRVYNAQTPDAREDRIRLQSFITSYSDYQGFRTPSKLTTGAYVNPGTWRDLEGVDSDKDLMHWTKANLLGCQDIAPYGVVPNIRYGHLYPKAK